MRIGIDPGVTGAIAILDEQLKCDYIGDMPTMSLGKSHMQVNASELAKILKSRIYEFGTLHTVYLEQVHSMPKQGVISTFNFGTSYGMIMGVCAALEFPLVLVSPNVWKKKASLIGKPKDAARTLAQQLYPEVDLSLKKHVGRADAILIARFGGL